MNESKRELREALARKNKKLKRVSISPKGWIRDVKVRVGSICVCTHKQRNPGKYQLSFSLPSLMCVITVRLAVLFLFPAFVYCSLSPFLWKITKNMLFQPRTRLPLRITQSVVCLMRSLVTSHWVILSRVISDRHDFFFCNLHFAV